MKYGMPTYLHNDEKYAFAAQKNYISIYINDESTLKNIDHS